MTNVTNRTRETINIIVGVKDGAAITDSVKAGETKDIDIMDVESAAVQGLILSAAIEIDGEAAAAPRKRAAAQASAGRSAPTLGGEHPIRE